MISLKTSKRNITKLSVWLNLEYFGDNQDVVFRRLVLQSYWKYSERLRSRRTKVEGFHKLFKLHQTLQKMLAVIATSDLTESDDPVGQC